MANTAETPLRNSLQIMAPCWLFSTNHFKLQCNMRLSGISPFPKVSWKQQVKNWEVLKIFFHVLSVEPYITFLGRYMVLSSLRIFGKPLISTCKDIGSYNYGTPEFLWARPRNCLQSKLCLLSIMLQLLQRGWKYLGHGYGKKKPTSVISTRWNRGHTKATQNWSYICWELQD